MMHCTMDDLLALRAGEGSVWARRHLADCAACRAELDAVYQRVAQLKALPALRPARDRWPAVRDVLHRERTGRRRTAGAWLGLAAAAALGGLLVFRSFTPSPAVDVAELDDIKARSATLEAALAGRGLEDRVMAGWEAALAAELEDRIAVIDGRLVGIGRAGGERAQPVPAPASELMNLWRQRVDLMDRLYTVRRAAYQGM
jgi:predicted anti-sigma-YlaC factor YlaD